MAVIFDGRAFAEKKEKSLTSKVNRLKKVGIVPKLVSILVGDNPASLIYVGRKKKVGERVGVVVEIERFREDVHIHELIYRIKTINKHAKVHGIMVQLPLPKNFSRYERDKILSTIDSKKDVDGLRNGSEFLTPVVKAVIEMLKEASLYLPSKGQVRVVVVGFRGFEGSKIFRVLEEMGYAVEGVDKKTKNLKLKTKNADVLISATGVPNLIKGDLVKAGAIVIDVGSPEGDVRTEEVSEKASFISPVPGGVGPVTISCLLENLIEAASVNNIKK